MKVSVITVCFNSASTIKKTLQSVADQDWPSIEHIVIDGGSTDGTLHILKDFNHVAKIISEPDRGIYDAMNKGLMIASGEIICFLNADDHYASNSILSYVVNTMIESKVDALVGDVEFFSKNNLNYVVRHYRSDRFSPKRFEWGWMPAHPALFMVSKQVRRVGKFKTSYQIAGDFEFIIRFFYKQEIQYYYSPMILVRMQAGGKSNSGLQAKIILNFEILRACRENGINTNIFKILARYPLKFLEFF